MVDIGASDRGEECLADKCVAQNAKAGCSYKVTKYSILKKNGIAQLANSKRLRYSYGARKMVIGSLPLGTPQGELGRPTKLQERVDRTTERVQHDRKSIRP